jgi:hypothetical protein
LDDGYSEWIGFIYLELALTTSQLRKMVRETTYFKCNQIKVSQPIYNIYCQ